ncbi:MAG: hypothetical protein RBQ97_04180 [Acholeplasma sp.]|nr:hypothetical protein [Acholeplasma sp.]
MKRIISLIITGISFLLVLSLSIGNSVNAFNFGRETDHGFYFNFTTPSVTNLISYSDYRLNIRQNTTDKYIMFNNALELYQFSIDVSYSDTRFSSDDKNHILSKNFTLGRDIDYSDVRSKRFIPIGYDVNGEYVRFTGNFDARGFEISNLYLANIDEITYVVSEGGFDVTYLYSEYFAMFNYNEGNIVKIGLTNPIVDLGGDHEQLNDFAYLVGLNKGVVSDVYVVDNRDIKNSGMKIPSTKLIGDKKNASGVISNNEGQFSNSYFSGKIVVNDGYIFALNVEPLITTNTGATTRLIYDSEIYVRTILSNGITISIPMPNIGRGYMTVMILQGTTELTNWYYYPNDTLPKMWGLNENNTKYEINNARDYIAFITLVNFDSMSRINQTIHYNESDYIVTNDINFKDVADDAYVIPHKEFKGSLEGSNKTTNWQLNNLSITEGVSVSNGHYLGLFSILSGTIKDLSIYNGYISEKELLRFQGQDFYIGFIAGQLEDGIINNVIVKGNMDFVQSFIQSYRIGGLVGEASGEIYKVGFSGNLEVGFQGWESNYELKGNSYMGGIVGKTGKKRLALYNAQTYDAHLIGLINWNYTYFTVKSYLGGIIGYVENTKGSVNVLGLLTSNSYISVDSIFRNDSIQYVSGVIGYSTGTSYILDGYHGQWTFKGEIDAPRSYNVGTLRIAGILSSGHNSDNEFVQLYSRVRGNFMTIDKRSFNSLIYHEGTGDLIISQAETDVENGYSDGLGADFSGVVNEISGKLTLRYLNLNEVNYITVGTLGMETRIAGVTLSENVDYLNVSYKGNLNITAIMLNHVLWVAGITHTLSDGNYMKNVVTDIDIYFEGRSTKNIYFAGMVNRNLAGDLQTQDGNNTPRASKGIINSINNSKITVEMDGTGNTYVGGVVTMNAGSIQDVINTGDILVYNRAVSGSVSFATEADSSYVTSYSSGIVIGGIAAMITDGTSRIYDTSNDGKILGINELFVRAGGIIGESLHQELVAGGVAFYLVVH